jgi:hypothetical protein
MYKNELSAGTKDEQRTAAESGTSASLEQNGLLAEVFSGMSKEEIDKKVKELAEIDAKIQTSEFISPVDLRKSDKLRAELYGHWNVVKGIYSKRVTSFTRDRR